ncbi:hypothetical protein B0H15DRAFT_952079 [Mycena belliarum]|uniref:Copper transporter n=1 Tax=Mycena belliarum TaxID=1033014 RepID=A0AAD6XLW7_9AGAR|nr:hypothetical protein B0H15DRAFT_952079 [Mycena belliae]
MSEVGDVLHWSLTDTHVIFASLVLDAPGGFALSSLLVCSICVLERLLSYAYDTRWGPARVRRSRGANALWRAGMYWVLAVLRLAYMLIVMTMHMGLILIAVTTLAAGQFLIELRTPPRDQRESYVPLADADAYVLARRTNGHVKPGEAFHDPTGDAWEAGKGPDAARTLIGGASKSARPGPRRAPFQIGAGDDSDEDEDERLG